LAVLNGQGIDESSLRKGAEIGQILVSLDDYKVRRVLGKGAKVEITSADGKVTEKKPVDKLKTLLGQSSLDPLVIMLEKDKQKRNLRPCGHEW
jgi:hypothetical protein